MTTKTELSGLTGEYVLDAERSRIGFVARHRVGGKVRGRFGVFDGALRADGGDPRASSAWLTAQADSIETGNQRRDAQLRKDFLDVATYPTVTVVSTEVTQTRDRRFDGTGDLTIRGTTPACVVRRDQISAARGPPLRRTRRPDDPRHNPTGNHPLRPGRSRRNHPIQGLANHRPPPLERQLEHLHHRPSNPNRRPSP